MQIQSLRHLSCRSWRVDERCGPAARERLGKLELYEKLRAEGCCEATALLAVGWSRATYYRWRRRYAQRGTAGLAERSRRPRRCRLRQWTPAHERAVLAVRDANPTWGKRKIAAVLRRDAGLALSDSTVGRILHRAMARGRIRPAAFYGARVKVKKARAFAGHAQRWRWGMKATRPGELLQVDHMSVSFPGCSVKNFTAACPVTGYLVARAYSRATATNAARFLDDIVRSLPFAVRSIQVDGGSEFRGAWEAACQARGIALLVLPPRSPKFNGCVERAHRSLREEFYATYRHDWRLDILNRALAQFQHHYCAHRPHGGRGRDLMTPMASYQHLAEAA